MKSAKILTIISILSTIPCLAQKEVKTIYGDAVIYVNKDYSARPFEKLLLITESHDREINDKIVKQFAKIEMPAVTSMDLLPPIKEYSDSDISEICKQHGIDGIIKVVLKDKEKGNARAMAQTKYFIEASLFDRMNNIVAVNFIGNAAAMNFDRAVYDYFRVIMPDLQPLLGKGK